MKKESNNFYKLQIKAAGTNVNPNPTFDIHLEEHKWS